MEVQRSKIVAEAPPCRLLVALSRGCWTVRRKMVVESTGEPLGWTTAL